MVPTGHSGQGFVRGVGAERAHSRTLTGVLGRGELTLLSDSDH